MDPLIFSVCSSPKRQGHATSEEIRCWCRSGGDVTARLEYTFTFDVTVIPGTKKPVVRCCPRSRMDRGRGRRSSNAIGRFRRAFYRANSVLAEVGSTPLTNTARFPSVLLYSLRSSSAAPNRGSVAQEPAGQQRLYGRYCRPSRPWNQAPNLDPMRSVRGFASVRGSSGDDTRKNFQFDLDFLCPATSSSRFFSKIVRPSVCPFRRGSSRAVDFTNCCCEHDMS